MELLTDKRFYVRYLVFCHSLIVASVPLLDIAIENSDGELREYFKRHRKEEEGHEAMVRNDLRALGVEGDIPISPYAAALAGLLYYNVRHDHPAHLLGYMGVLESNSMPPKQVEALVATFGENATTAVRHHSRHDPGHAKVIAQEVKRLPLSLMVKVTDAADNTVAIHRAWHDHVQRELQWPIH